MSSSHASSQNCPPTSQISNQTTNDHQLINQHQHELEFISQMDIFDEASTFRTPLLTPASSSLAEDDASTASPSNISMNLDYDLPEEICEDFFKEDPELNRDNAIRKGVSRQTRRSGANSESNAIDRLENIRERNRVAARKYREKQKSRNSKLRKEENSLRMEHGELLDAARKLQMEISLLKLSHLNHLCWNCRREE